MEYLPQQNRNHIILHDDIRTECQYPLSITTSRTYTDQEQFWRFGSTISISVLVCNTYNPVRGKGFSFVPIGMNPEDVAEEENPAMMKEFVVDIWTYPIGPITDFQSEHPFSVLRRDPSFIRVQGMSLAPRHDTTITIAVKVESLKPFFLPPQQARRPLIEIMGMTRDEWLHHLHTEGDP